METLQQTDDIPLLPTELWSDEPPVESDLHLQQITLLLACLDWLWSEKTDYYASGNLTIYYNQEQLKNKDFCGSDFFVVLNTEKRPRKSWVVWGEGGNYPNVIVEILSDSTANIDRTKKKELYQNTFRTPEYFWFDPNSLEFQGFVLVGGNYQPIEPNKDGYLESQQLGLYLGIYENKLRYFTLEGELVPTPKEAAIQERLEKEQERLEKEREKLMRQQIQEELEQEKQRSAQLEQKLRELGINLDE
ncbi:MAG: Uma2 family endonuclease [Microcystaceae cyanobacterium]